MKVNVKVLDDMAVLPTKATDGSACYDVTCFDGQLFENRKLITFRTGLAVEIPRGYAIKIHPRSSLFKKWGLKLANQTGIIDSDYRGEIICYFNYLDDCFTPWKGIKQEKLVQMELVRQSNKIEWNTVDALSDTERGDGGFGSTS
jgi:dUTP pyrophosphatase